MRPNLTNYSGHVMRGIEVVEAFKVEDRRLVFRKSAK